jgi:hypothetical protein
MFLPKRGKTRKICFRIRLGFGMTKARASPMRNSQKRSTRPMER